MNYKKSTTWFKAILHNISETKYLLPNICCFIPRIKMPEIPQHLPQLKINDALMEKVKSSSELFLTKICHGNHT